MIKWNNQKRSDNPDQIPYAEIFNNVTEGLQETYRERILPLEKQSHFHLCWAEELGKADFSAKPMILLIGQYSTGIRMLFQCFIRCINSPPTPPQCNQRKNRHNS